jgi:Zn-dependent protease with chaperone function
MNNQLNQLEQSILKQDADSSLRLNFTLGERHPTAYLGVMIFITSLAYVWLFLFPLLLLSLLFLIPYQLMQISSYDQIPVILLEAVVAVVAAWVSYALYKLQISYPSGRPLPDDEAPVLRNLLDELARKQNAPRIHRVRIVRDLSIDIIRTPVNGYPFACSRSILIGLPLMQSLSVRQLLARIDREIIISTVKYTRPASWIVLSTRLWCQYNAAWRKNWSLPSMLMRSFFSWYAPLYKLLSQSAFRMQHYYADSQIHTSLGDNTLIEMLVTENISGHYLRNDFWPHLYKKAYRHKQPPYLPYTSLDHNLRAKFSQLDAQAWLNADLEKSVPLTNAPTLRQRLDRLAIHRVILPPPVTESAAKYFLANNLKVIAGQLDKVWLKTHEFEWQQKYQQGLVQQQRLRSLIMQAMQGLLTEDTSWELLQLGKRFLSEEQMLPLSRQILQSSLTDARIYFDIGRSLLVQDDEQGVMALEKAINLDESYTVIACQLITKYFVHIGNSRSAQNYRRRALAFQVSAA